MEKDLCQNLEFDATSLLMVASICQDKQAAVRKEVQLADMLTKQKRMAI